ncbi:serine hydrolase domain-containing protein [Devosia albogilva]|uniref:Serine hydrolase domain-containing protein n=1 Tax=Devosia albogilva TaxID=429726 RepID=A0ABW5QQU0_9HYPH
MGNKLDSAIDAAIAGGRIVGAEVIVARHGEIVYRRAAGHSDREAGVPMPENAIYRLASVTKPLIAATALAMVDKGLLRLDDPVTDHLPYFRPKLADGTIPVVTIHHLLTHTSGLGYSYPAHINTGLGPTRGQTLDENTALIGEQPLSFASGTGWQYSVATDVLGAVLARVHGGTLGDAVAAHVTGPLGMKETGYFVADPQRLAKAYADGDTEPVPMEDPHVLHNHLGGPTTFSPSRIFDANAFHSGGAGMAGTPGDIFRFLEALRRGGAPILRPETVDLAFSNRIGDLPRDDAGQRFGYFGAIVDDPQAAQTPEAPGTVNWGGVYGHSWLVDPVNGVTMLSMSNTAFEGCLGAFPRQVRNAAYAEYVF